MRQLDVKLIFLNESLEDVHVKHLQDFEIKVQDKIMYMLKKIYELKQAHRVWNMTTHNFLIKLDLNKCISEHIVDVKGLKLSCIQKNIQHL